MNLEMRSVTDETYPAFVEMLGVTFQFDPSDDETENFRNVNEFDRGFMATEGDTIVGTGGAFTYELSTPGAQVNAGGLTAVAVLPTHRRRGVLTSMMHRHYEDVREREEPVSILWASEWPIYGRFGYGQATQGVEMSIDTSKAALPDFEAPGQCRMVTKDDARKLLPEVYERVRWRAGALSRPPVHWEHRHFYDPESWRSGFTAHRYTVYEEDGSIDGYVMWRSKDNWDEGVPGGTVRVLELMAATPAAERALWGFVLSLDLTAKVSAGRRPVDDALWMMLADRRRLQRKVSDALWVSILDVPNALEARRYAVPGELTIEVVGSFVDGIDGTYRLAGGRDGAECTPASGSADLTVSAAELGALYLGGSRLRPMVTWGSAQGSEEAIRLADAMFGWDEAPWCPEIF